MATLLKDDAGIPIPQYQNSLGEFEPSKGAEGAFNVNDSQLATLIDRVAAQNQDVGDIKTSSASILADVALILSSVSDMLLAATTVSSNSTDIKADVADIKTGVTDTGSDVTLVKADVSDIKTSVTNTEATASTISSDVSDILDAVGYGQPLTPGGSVISIFDSLSNIGVALADMSLAQQTTNSLLNDIKTLLTPAP